MLASVRNRRAVITSVEPHSGADQVRWHLVNVDYLDPGGASSETLLWECEAGARLYQPLALPQPDDTRPLTHEHFDALVRGARWNALAPYLDPDGSHGPLSRLPLTAPLQGAFQVEDYQLVPLLKARTMPRVSLLLADDVGLGKTIEAGLVLRDLIHLRRIRRVLIACPASLCIQWQEEMSSKFSVGFDLVNRDTTQQLRKRLGLDANPWRAWSHAITSYHYLKQEDVLEQFLASSEQRSDSTHLPWDLLILDEAHNLVPSAFGDESDLSQMLGRISPMFEHKVFLTATPHNGHTRCFSGLLERLDPVRFSRTSELTPAVRARIPRVVIRRLKSEINERDKAAGRTPRFAERHLSARPLDIGNAEAELSAAFAAFRTSLREEVESLSGSQVVAGNFAIEVLGKRLLSCPAAFANSWARCKAGLGQEEEASAADVIATGRAASEDIGDDRETESRTAQAAGAVGAWLRPFAEALKTLIARIDDALVALDLGESWEPNADARFDALCACLDELLRVNGAWRADERMVLFTEYKTTLDYLHQRLARRYGNGALLTLFGGMDPDAREDVKRAFNNPKDAVRLLLATDTGSEGLNLQETARYLFHFDVPWNPSRLEQRNGRLDRHGQARDVTVFHFDAAGDDDIRFLAYVVGKVDTIRHDLGSVGEVFDAAFREQIVHGRAVGHRKLDESVEEARSRTTIITDDSEETGEAEMGRLAALRGELDLDPDTLRTTLGTAIASGASGPGLQEPGPDGRVLLAPSLPAAWRAVADDCLRLRRKDGALGPMPALAFDPAFFVESVNGRSVYRARQDTALMHIAHPLIHRALVDLAQRRYTAESRWTVRRGPVPDGVDALVLLTVEEMAVNELREPFHHWVHTICFPVSDGDVGQALSHQSAVSLRTPNGHAPEADTLPARAIWNDVETDVKAALKRRAAALGTELRQALETDQVQELKDERERFQSRQGELAALKGTSSIEKLQREYEQLMQARRQLTLGFAKDIRAQLKAAADEAQEELKRRTAHIDEMQAILRRERKRVLENVIPMRHTMHGDAQVFPVAVEIRLPEMGGAR
jgi:hypothetical protein